MAAEAAVGKLWMRIFLLLRCCLALLLGGRAAVRVQVGKKKVRQGGRAIRREEGGCSLSGDDVGDLLVGFVVLPQDGGTRPRV